tara:strand:+ start:2173 stop:4677 length:2505 start_codon:yes stop_codon:yes gene_type:complete
MSGAGNRRGKKAKRSMFVRIFGFLFAFGTVAALSVGGVAAYFLTQYAEELPDYEVLSAYEPPVMTRVHAADGVLIAEYAKERRLYLPAATIPDLLKAAFLSAEDKNFYRHQGIDYVGIATAMARNIQGIGSGRRFAGASTITQQVAKNFLLSSERTMTRKVKEAMLALRIEQAYTKDKILELYLNEIYLGLGSYGVAAASLNYFDKSVHELTLEEAAYLAALPKGPNNYHPFRETEAAIERRNYVLDRMQINGYVTSEQSEAAKALPLRVRLREYGGQTFAADFFAEEVRRQLLEIYGEEKLYGGGLSVRTTLDPVTQVQARAALQNGLIKFDEARGWRGPKAKVELTAGSDWGKLVGEIEPLSDVPEWSLAVVLDVNAEQATLGIRPDSIRSRGLSDDRKTGVLPLENVKWAKWSVGERKGRAVKGVSDVVSVGDVIFVEQVAETDATYRLRQIPEINGAMVVMDPHTGRVKALVGGFSFDASEFNRATQANRQPGSSFKPIVYATALDNGYTPSSVVMDAPIEISSGGQIWKPQNYGRNYLGPSTLRTGIERSRNVMTVRLAQDMGMPLIAEYARRFGVYDNLQPVLSMALGAGETTAMRMASAFSVFANGGRKIEPTLIDRIQDRFGKTIFRHDQRVCEGCEATSWAGQEEPVLIDERMQVLDPMTAYQVTSMLEGVVQRGTATVVREVGKPIAGKTGTTNDEKDAWFVGFSPDLVAAVYVGYDNPRPMGRGATGGQLAAPIFRDFMMEALADSPAVPFRLPQGLTLIPIDRKTGLRASGESEGVIMEAFKPGTAPPDDYSVIGYSDGFSRPLTVAPESDRAVISGTGGLY